MEGSTYIGMLISFGSFVSLKPWECYDLLGGNQQAVAGVSVGTTFVLFLGIVAYHALKQIVSSNLYKVVTMKLINLFHLKKHRNQLENSD